MQHAVKLGVAQPGLLCMPAARSRRLRLQARGAHSSEAGVLVLSRQIAGHESVA